ncbi:molybdopterin molybdotransferase MoeA [Halorubellus salinus]|uniref:molybdopterin molybdotransferase MoeA n=1 Tax=Halorubellus salinus TaxID=755309 RepID=UPI001D06AFA0|nr:molybdopterin molybdotransferase MoeA [Halorubellus salinus]
MTVGRGFRDRTRLAAARDALLDAVAPVGRTEAVTVADADGRVLAGPVTPARPVPHYDRAAMDGYAVVAESTFGASDRSPTVLRVRERGDGDAPAVDSRTAVPVHTGSELPEGADAVVMVERTERFGDEVEVEASVTVGENVSPVGEDVLGDVDLFADGHRLRPSDLGLVRSVGRTSVEVYEHPVVDVVPTGDELVPADAERAPDPGEVVETNALTVSRYVDAWGGTANYRDVVPDDDALLRDALERGVADSDLVVTIGGSSVGERDRLAAVVADAGRVVHHGLAIKPGHPAGFGVVDDTPILMLPGSPVSCIVTAVSLLRPALKRAGHLPTVPLPTTTATLDRKVASEPGVRQFVRVALQDPDSDADHPPAVPVRASGANVLSSVTDADGWVTIPESVEGLDAGATVAVEDWEYRP